MLGSSNEIVPVCLSDDIAVRTSIDVPAGEMSSKVASVAAGRSTRNLITPRGVAFEVSK